MKTEIKAVYGVGAVIISILIWMQSNVASKEDFERHVATQQCKEATSELLYWEREARNDPQSTRAQDNLRKAQEVKAQQCAKKS